MKQPSEEVEKLAYGVIGAAIYQVCLTMIFCRPNPRLLQEVGDLSSQILLSKSSQKFLTG